MVKGSGVEGGRGRSFVRDLFGLVYSKEAEVAENLQVLEDLEILEALPGAEF